MLLMKVVAVASGAVTRGARAVPRLRAISRRGRPAAAPSLVSCERHNLRSTALYNRSVLFPTPLYCQIYSFDKFSRRWAILCLIERDRIPIKLISWRHDCSNTFMRIVDSIPIHNMYYTNSTRIIWFCILNDRMIEWKLAEWHFVLSDAIQNDGLGRFISGDRRSEHTDRWGWQ